MINCSLRNPRKARLAKAALPRMFPGFFKNKDHGKMSAAMSLGSVLLWDVEGGLPQADTFLVLEEPLVVAGGLSPSV